MRITKKTRSGERREQGHDPLLVEFSTHSGGVLYLVAYPFEIILSSVDIAKIREALKC